VAQVQKAAGRGGEAGDLRVRHAIGRTADGG
jgi:hypothetical protein